MKDCRITAFAGLLALFVAPLDADQNLAGNVTVTGGTSTGNLFVTGNVDIDGATVAVGSPSGGGVGASFLYSDTDVDTLTFSVNRNAGSWRWMHNTAKTAMRLSTLHELLLYQSDGSTAGVTLLPATSAIKLGALATLTGDAGGVITTSGGFTVGGSFASTTGSLAGGATGLTLNAGGTNQSVVLNSSGGDVIFRTNGTERARITSTGNMGIGTSSPAFVTGSGLEIQRNGAPATLRLERSGDGSAAEIVAGNAQLAFRLDPENLVGSSNINFSIDGVDRLRITNDGNVGIFAVTPLEKLHLKGNLLFESANTAQWRIVPEPTVNDRILQFENASGAATGGFAFKATNASFDAVRLMIRNDGNVGVGTSTPGSPLTVFSNSPNALLVQGNSTNSVGVILNNTATSGSWSMYHSGGASAPVGSLGFYDNAAGAPRLVINPTGNVGIGVSSPTSKLQVNGDNVEIGLGRSTGDSTTYSRIGQTTNYDTWWGTNTRFDGTNWVYINTGGWGSMASMINQGSGNIYLNTVNGGVNPITWSTRLFVANNGNIGIGTTNPSHKLAVNGTIRAKEVIVDTGWADYVFEEDYRLAPLAEVEAHIREKKHLPGIPSAAEVEAHGVSMGDMQAMMMAKIEELTLHLIAQEKRLSRLETENRALRAQLSPP